MLLLLRQAASSCLSFHNREVTTSTSSPTVLPRAVIFDFGKVLSALPDVDAHTALVEAAGVPDAVFEEHYWAHRHAYDAGALNGETYWQSVAEGAGFVLSAEKLARLHHHDCLMWGNLNASMLDWAKALQRAGFKTAILSNMGEVNLAYMRRSFEWLADFTYLTWSCELRTAKPDPAIYQHTLERLGVNGPEAMFIDDIPANIAAARSLGIDAILFEDVLQLRKQLAARGLDGRMPMPQPD
jgi:putative hydrolase of the HAD superfamily